MPIKLFFLFSLFITQATSAQTKQVSKRYCLPKSTSIDEVLSELKVFLLPSDKYKFDREYNCLIITMGPNRVKIIEKIIDEKFVPRQRIVQPSQLKETCRISLITTKKNNDQNNNLKIAKKSTLSQGQSNDVQESQSFLLLTSGQKGKLQLGDDAIEISCLKRKNGFDLEVFAVAGDSSVSSSLFVRPDQSVNIGEIVRKISSQSLDANSREGVQKDNLKKKESIQYSIKVN